MTRAECSYLVKQRDADAERIRVAALWNARRKFRVFDDDVTAIGRMLRTLREGDTSRRWRIWQ